MSIFILLLYNLFFLGQINVGIQHHNIMAAATASNIMVLVYVEFI